MVLLFVVCRLIGIRFGCFRLFLLWREIDLKDRVGRTHGGAFPAKLAFFVIDISQVVFHGDGIKGANFHTFATSDAGHFTRFFGDGTFVLVNTADKNTASFRALLAQFDDVFGTGIYTGAASNTIVFYDDWQAGFFVHVHRIEITSFYAISQSVATV